jgi:hypothetical protein
VTVRLVEVAAVTVALTDPNQTKFKEGAGLKLLPVMVTVEPTGPDVGEKEVMTGCEKTRKGYDRMSQRHTRLGPLRKSGLMPGQRFGIRY